VPQTGYQFRDVMRRALALINSIIPTGGADTGAETSNESNDSAVSNGPHSRTVWTVPLGRSRGDGSPDSAT
jgi:hypothetical protein